MSKEKVLDLKDARVSLVKFSRQYRIDIFIVSVLAIGIGLASFLNAQKVPDVLLTDFYAQDIWFGSDIPTVFGNITSLNSDFGRNNKHPLFPLIAFPPIFLLGKFLHLEPISAARLVVAFVACLWIIGLFVLFRLMGCRRLDATLFSLLGGMSAASVFWFTVPESFSFGSATILLALVFTALTQYRKFSPNWYVAVSGLTVSITITNWMAGILATIVNHRWKKALQITVITLGVVTALWIVQRSIFSNAGFPFQPKTFIGEKKFISEPAHGSILSALSSFVYQTIVMPAVQFQASPLRPDWPKLEVNTLAPGSGGFWGTIAVLAWTGLLSLGVWGFFATKQHPKLRIVLGITILGQLLMHSIYGTQETFIYSLHFAPLLLTVAAFSSLTHLRWLGLVLTGLLLVSAGINNRSQFNQVTATLLDYGTPHQQVQAQMRARPSDPWPRSQGHVVLATPGSSEQDKAYYEPGGSFSPIAGSFGVSIWIVDPQGNLKTTSDTIPLNQIQQQFAYAPGKSIPGILTQTEYYQASWSAPKSGTWQLNLKVPASSNTKPVVVIRSVGPAGGEVKSLNWNGQQLLINDRWSVKVGSQLAKVYLGSENSPDWIKQKSTLTQWEDPKGWGYARFEMGDGDAWNLVVEDSTPAPKSDLKFAAISSNLNLDLPDSQFLSSLNAQVAHLMMGLVGNQTRPIDPLDYPLPRLRDGAYTLVALARAGQLEVAKQLSTYFAENDFFNGVTPQADAPALGVWALEAVAEQLQQPAYDQWLWPHVQRKAGLIVNMLSTNRPGYPVAEKVEPSLSENPDFLSVDMMAGKMDHTPGLISLDPAANFMSYRALLDAATLADRVQQTAAAQQWRTQAEQLQAAWKAAFDRKFSQTDTTYTNGLWPTWLATASQNAFVQGLQQRWNQSRDQQGAYRQAPMETYLNLAETHQWLYLNEPDRVWTTLQWFWQNQASPGLYTWWGANNAASGTPIPKSFSHWYRTRGWVNPPHTTPHYWTAAEMLLLQLDMLAYVHPSASMPTLVIGAGIPEQWLKQPMRVQGLRVGGNLVNWVWDGKQMTVQIKGKKPNVQLGRAFPASTPLKVVMLQETT